MGKKQRKTAVDSQERERVERTLGLIERGFDGAPPPDQQHRTLFQAEAWDAYERIDQRKDHKGRWQDLPDSHIHECTNALAHLDEQGIRYYLPALMSYFVRAPQARRLWSYESLLYTLQPSTGDLKAHQRQRFSLLTRPQREAILAYLEHIEAPEEDLLPWRRVLAAGDEPDWFRKFY
jgi:hypothetical protein